MAGTSTSTNRNPRTSDEFLHSILASWKKSAEHIRQEIQHGVWTASLDSMIVFLSKAQKALESIEEDTKIIYDREIIELQSEQKVIADSRRDLHTAFDSPKQEYDMAVAPRDQLDSQVASLKHDKGGEKSGVQTPYQQAPEHQPPVQEEEVDIPPEARDPEVIDQDCFIALTIQLEEELQKYKRMAYCRICMAVPKDALIVPCMHFHYCIQCAHEFGLREGKCARCNATITDIIHCNLGDSP